jgi:prepilin peptidase CpaA
MPKLLYLCLLIQLLFVAYWDFRFQKISNWWAIGNLILFLLLLWALPQHYPLQWRVGLYPGLLLGIGFVLYLLKIMGAGDVKYLFGFFLLIPISLQAPALERLAYSTILVGGFLLAFKIVPNIKIFYRALLTRQWLAIKELLRGKNVFAPIVLLSWFWLGWEQWDIIFR